MKLKWQFAFIFLKVFVIFLQTGYNNKDHIWQNLMLFQEASVKLDLKTFAFFRNHINCFYHASLPKHQKGLICKIEAVCRLKHPTATAELQSFLGRFNVFLFLCRTLLLWAPKWTRSLAVVNYRGLTDRQQWCSLMGDAECKNNWSACIGSKMTKKQLPLYNEACFKHFEWALRLKIWWCGGTNWMWPESFICTKHPYSNMHPEPWTMPRAEMLMQTYLNGYRSTDWTDHDALEWISDWKGSSGKLRCCRIRYTHFELDFLRRACTMLQVDDSFAWLRRTEEAKAKNKDDIATLCITPAYSWESRWDIYIYVYTRKQRYWCQRRFTTGCLNYRDNNKDGTRWTPKINASINPSASIRAFVLDKQHIR